MWVYWLTLGFLSIVLYFPYKKFFTNPVAVRASIATFIIGMIYPLLQTKLSVAQIFFSLGLLLVFLGATISRNHPYWEGEKPEETGQTNLSPDTTGTEFAGTRIQEMEAHHNQELIKTAEPFVANTEIPDDSHGVNSVLPAQQLVIQEEPVREGVKGGETGFSTAELTVKAEPVAPGEFLDENNPCKQVMISSEEEPAEIVMEADVGEKAVQEDNLPTVVSEESAPSEDVSEPLMITDDISGEIRFPEDVPQQDILPVETLQEGEHTPDISLKTEIPEDPSQTPGFSEDSPVDSATKEIKQSPEALLVEGLHLAKFKQYAQAVRHFNKVIAYGAEPELLYMAISELSSIYQHLGLYPMALEIINAFAEHPYLKEHPGMSNLKQKARFIQCLIDLLNRDRYGHIPYEQVPEAVRREAFDNSLNIKHLIS